MKLNTHLWFDGNCEAAFKLYADCLRGKITILLTYGESPLAARAQEYPDKILHAALQLDDQEITGSDVPPGQYATPQGFTIMLNLDDTTEAEKIFSTLSEGGVVRMSLEKTFWAARYGELTDRFGTPWAINCSEPANLGPA